MAHIAQSLAGIAGLIALAWMLSENRRDVPWRAVFAGLLLQFLLALAALKLPVVKAAFQSVNNALGSLETATRAGTSLVFGYLGGAGTPFAEVDSSATFILAFRALPLVILISALSSLLYYWRILPLIVHGLSWVLERAMGIGGALGLSAAANVFVGQVEAPLVVKPYLSRVSRGELFAIMAGGMASTSGTVLFLEAAILRDIVPDAISHMLIASLISAPAALAVSFVMVPPDRVPTGGQLALKSDAEGAMDAITRGTFDGAQLFGSIIAMLIVFVALVTLTNLIIAPYSLQNILGWCMAPLAWLSGVPWHEAHAAGMLIGSKTVLNEIVAYLDMSKMTELSERSRLLMTYALCGFANFGSLGILIGGMSSMCPERRSEVVQLGMRSIIAGTFTTCLMAATVGLIV